MIRNPISVLAARFAFARRAEVAETARRWRKAFAAIPGLRNDLIRLGGLFDPQWPVTLRDGIPTPDPVDPYRLAYEAGQRDLANQILALGGLTHADVTNLLQESDDE